MGNSVQDLLEMLYTMVNDAWGIPLGADKCVIEREKTLDLLDELKAQLPQELAEAKRLIEARDEFVGTARKDAENLRKAAEERARFLVSEQEIVKEAKAKSEEILAAAETRAAELKRVANEYAEDTLRRTEEAISEALEEVKSSRTRFRSVAGAQAKPDPIVPDLDDEEPIEE